MTEPFQFDETKIPDEQGYFTLTLEDTTFICRMRLRELRRLERLLGSQRSVPSILDGSSAFGLDEMALVLTVALTFEFQKRKEKPGKRKKDDVLSDERVEEMITSYRAPPAPLEDCPECEGTGETEHEGEMEECLECDGAKQTRPEPADFEDLLERLMTAMTCAIPGGRQKLIKMIERGKKDAEREAKREDRKADREASRATVDPSGTSRPSERERLTMSNGSSTPPAAVSDPPKSGVTPMTSTQD